MDRSFDQRPTQPLAAPGELLDIWPSAAPSSLEPAAHARRPRPSDGPPEADASNELLLGLLEHLTTLSSLIAASSRVSSARLDALEAQVEKLVAEVQAMRRLVQDEAVVHRPLTDDEVHRIADGVAKLLGRQAPPLAPGPRSASRPAA